MESTSTCRALASICGSRHELRRRQGVSGCCIGPSPPPNIWRPGPRSLSRTVHRPSPECASREHDRFQRCVVGGETKTVHPPPHLHLARRWALRLLPPRRKIRAECPAGDGPSGFAEADIVPSAMALVRTIGVPTGEDHEALDSPESSRGDVNPTQYPRHEIVRRQAEMVRKAIGHLPSVCLRGETASNPLPSARW